MNERVRAQLAAGEVEEAARSLVALGRPSDAARLLLASLGGDPRTDARARQRVYLAASCLVEGSDRRGAAELLAWMGDTARARAVLGQAAPVAASSPAPRAAALREAGRPRDAAQVFESSGMLYEAGVCFFEAGDLEAAMQRFLSVPQDNRRYRSACLYVAHIAARTGALPFEVDHFLVEFSRSDPRSPQEIEALVTLGVLYEGQGFEDEAREAYARVLRVAPAREDVAARLRNLETGAGGRGDLTNIAAEDMSFWAPGRRSAPEPEEIDEPSGAAVSGVTEKTPAPVERPPVPIGPGAKIAERYVIESEIGRGGMGVVYSARDLELGELVAMKLATGRFDDPAGPARFKQELMLCRQIAHPNVIRVHDIGVHDQRKFITMELLVGKSLKELVPGLDLRGSIACLIEICEGLAAIPARGIVHRDLKPPNVFVTNDGAVKIMDFGLAKKVGAPDGVTVSGFMAGTPGYMPPEQVMEFGKVTCAADLYALGAIAYELVTKTRPFRHSDAAQLIRLQLMTEPAPPSAVDPSIPKPLEELILALLAREPTQRPADVTVVKNALSALRG